MIPDKFVPNKEDARQIVCCIADETKYLLSLNIRFYIVKINKNILYSTLHHCCTEIDQSVIPSYQGIMTNKIVNNTKIKKVIWE